MDLWNDYLKWIIAVMLTFTVGPYLAAWITSLLGRVSKKMLVNGLGPNAQLAVGGLGVMIHESGHALFALLFGHRITRFQIINFHYAENGTLGSVNHSWNENNIYQKLGNFFIGLAPYYMCSIVLYLLQKFLLHNTLDLSALNKTVEFNSFTTIISAVFDNFLSIFSNASWPMVIIYLILTIMIASTGYDLSQEDLQTVYRGLTPWLIVLFIVALFATFLNLKTQMVAVMSLVIVFSVLFMIQALLYIIVSMLFIKIISLV